MGSGAEFRPAPQAETKVRSWARFFARESCSLRWTQISLGERELIRRNLNFMHIYKKPLKARTPRYIFLKKNGALWDFRRLRHAPEETHSFTWTPNYGQCSDGREIRWIRVGEIQPKSERGRDQDTRFAQGSNRRPVMTNVLPLSRPKAFLRLNLGLPAYRKFLRRSNRGESRQWRAESSRRWPPDEENGPRVL